MGHGEIERLRAENDELSRRLQRLLAEGHGRDGAPASSPGALLAELEDRSEAALSAFPFAVWRCDAEGRCTFVNDAWCGFTGRTPQQELGAGRLEGIHPDDVERCRALIDESRAARRPFHLAYRLRRHDGHHRWVVEWALPESDAEGRFAGFVAVTQDISERRLEDDAQRALERRILRQQDAIVRIATDRAVVDGDLAGALRVLTETVADVLEVERVSVWLFDEARERLECHELFVRSTRRFESEPPLVVADRPIYIEAIEGDRALDAHEALTDPRTQELLDYLRPLRITSMLDAGVRLDGRVVGVVCHEHVGEPRAWQPDELAFAGEVADQVAQALLGAQRRRAQAELERTLEILDKAQRIARLGCWEWDPGTGLVRWSDELYRLHGRSPRRDELMTFEAAVAAIHPEDRDAVVEFAGEVASGAAAPGPVEYRIVRADGAVRTVVGEGEVQHDAQGRVTRLLGTVHDITERKREEQERAAFESRVQRAQKLESLGILAGGVAHDFNNLLVSVLGHAGMVLQDLPADSPIRPQLEDIERSAQEAARLAHQMLAYSGHGRFTVSRVDVSRLVRETGPLLEASIPRRIELVFEPAESPVVVEGDATQLRQVVVNLVTNAADAAAGRRGSITLRTREIDADAAVLDRASVGDGLGPGRYAALEVVDAGCGMDASTQARVFDPFFTTKETGRGLGLPAVLGIVRGHRGGVLVDSRPGAGTTVTVLIPLATEAAEARPDAAPPGAGAREDGHTGRVLIADDEESVRFVAQAMLERIGFEVLTAGDGIEALEVLDREGGAIDLVLLDVTMPRLGGLETLAALRERRADVRVVLTSGYGRAEVSPDGPRPDAFLHKPYRMPQLAAALEEALGEDAPAAAPPPAGTDRSR